MATCTATLQVAAAGAYETPSPFIGLQQEHGQYQRLLLMQQTLECRQHEVPNSRPLDFLTS